MTTTTPKLHRQSRLRLRPAERRAWTVRGAPGIWWGAHPSRCQECCAFPEQPRASGYQEEGDKRR